MRNIFLNIIYVICNVLTLLNQYRTLILTIVKLSIGGHLGGQFTFNLVLFDLLIIDQF